MAVYVSPGVYVREIDLSLYVPSLSTTIVGMVGRSTKGPTNTRTYITSQQQFVTTFGNPDSALGFESYAALQYLRRGRQLWYVRIVGPSAALATGEFNYWEDATPVTAEAQTPTPALNGVILAYAGTLTAPSDRVKPTSLQFETLVGGSLIDDIIDDGEGAITSVTDATLTGTINYLTGAWTLTFTVAPDIASTPNAITAAYTAQGDSLAFTAEALSEGEWGNEISIKIEPGTTSGSFQMSIYDHDVLMEREDDLNLDNGTTDYVETRINGISTYITVDVDAGVGDDATGLPYDVLTPVALADGDSDSGNVEAADIIGVAWDDTLAQSTGLQLFASPNAIDLNLLAAPGWSDAAVVNELIQICETRADCLAVIDPPENLNPQEVVDWHNGQDTWEGDHAAFNSSYAALYWPWVRVYDSYNRQYVYTPPSGHILAVYAYNDTVGESWFAPAGLQRGKVISGVDIEYDPTVGEMELMYGSGNAVNMIERFAQDGIVVWGQRTLQRTPTATDRVNVRRLLLYLRKVISSAVRLLVFEPNDEKTWNVFGHLVTPFLQEVTGRRGLYDFRAQCDATTNTPEVIDRNEMHARIFVKPVKAAEFIQIDLVITRTGANFDEILY